MERCTGITDFDVQTEIPTDYPVQARLRNEKTGVEETVGAKFLVGSDGAASMIRKKLDIPFDGVSTDIYWGIMDCIFESDYPHSWVFGYYLVQSSWPLDRLLMDLIGRSSPQSTVDASSFLVKMAISGFSPLKSQ